MCLTKGMFSVPNFLALFPSENLACDVQFSPAPGQEHSSEEKSSNSYRLAAWRYFCGIIGLQSVNECSTCAFSCKKNQQNHSILAVPPFSFLLT